MAWMTKEQIACMGFFFVGQDVLLSDKASFYGCERIRLGSNVRIDDFCILSAGAGGIEIGNYIHVAAYSSLIGGGRIVMSDYSNISSRVSIYSSNDDYSGEFMTNPCVPGEFTNVYCADVFIGKHVIVGAGSVVLPGVTIGEGVVIGSLSLVKRDCHSFGVYAGAPVRCLKERSRGVLEKETLLMQGQPKCCRK